MAERKRLFRPQPLYDLLLDRPIPGKPRQRARVQVAFLEDLEPPAHHPEGMGEAPDLVPAVHPEVVIKLPSAIRAVAFSSLRSGREILYVTRKTSSSPTTRLTRLSTTVRREARSP